MYVVKKAFNNNFIVQFIEWKYILHFGGCIKRLHKNTIFKSGSNACIQ